MAASKETSSAKRNSPAGGPPSPISHLLGNVVLVVILVSLVSIPFLVYATDMPRKVKRNVRELAEAFRGKPQIIEKIVEKRVEVPTVVEKAVPAPSLPKPEPVEEKPAEPVVLTLPRQEYDVAKLFNGINVKTTLDLESGMNATQERIDDGAYQFEIKLKINVPKANKSADELAALNPHLPQMLPHLGKLIQTCAVSPFYERLYSLKHERIKNNLTRLDSLETRHNYYDCETILQLTHPDTGQKALLMQGEMDVVADGSDGDRMPELDDYISLSTHYQPMTSYGWAKRTAQPNPLVARWEKRIAEAKEEFAIQGLSAERNTYLKNLIAQLTREMTDIKSRSYLIAEADPFIVLPLSLLNQSNSHAPAIGDFACVIVDGKIYPAICGDAGPSWKMGEASLFVAQTMNSEASPYRRPVSDLKVTYLIFPGSKEPTNEPPDLAKWKDKCNGFLTKLGGLGESYALHDWRDIIAERRAVRETKALLGKASLAISNADGSATEAKKALESAKKKSTEAAKKLADAKTAGTTDLTALQAKVDETAADVKSAEAAVATATAAAAKAREQSKLVEAAVQNVVKVTALPLTTPKTETTDVALKILADATSAVTLAEAEAKSASEAAQKAKSAAG